MKKTSIALIVLVIAAIAMPMAGALANCDKFGSCEDTTNNLSCGGAPTANAVVAKAYANANGAEVCNDNGPIPPYGRISVFRESNNNVSVSVDGDNNNPGTQGWTRVDVRPGGGGCKAQVRRGSTGYGYGTGGTSSPADVADSSVIACP